MLKNCGDLKVGEVHPSAVNALEEIIKLSYSDLIMWQEAFASCAIEGNRLGEICVETLRRIIKGQSVSDRYVLGLYYAIFNNKLKTVAYKKGNPNEN